MQRGENDAAIFSVFIWDRSVSDCLMRARVNDAPNRADRISTASNLWASSRLEHARRVDQGLIAYSIVYLLLMFVLHVRGLSHVADKPAIFREFRVVIVNLFDAGRMSR